MHIERYTIIERKITEVSKKTYQNSEHSRASKRGSNLSCSAPQDPSGDNVGNDFSTCVHVHAHAHAHARAYADTEMERSVSDKERACARGNEKQRDMESENQSPGSILSLLLLAEEGSWEGEGRERKTLDKDMESNQFQVPAAPVRREHILSRENTFYTLIESSFWS